MDLGRDGMRNGLIPRTLRKSNLLEPVRGGLTQTGDPSCKGLPLDECGRITIRYHELPGELVERVNVRCVQRSDPCCPTSWEQFQAACIAAPGGRGARIRQGALHELD